MGWSMFGPRCHLEEEVRMGASGKGSFIEMLGQGLANFFHKGPGGKNLRLCRPYDLCCNYSALLLGCENNHRQHENTCVAAFIHRDGLDLACELYFAHPALCSRRLKPLMAQWVLT